VFTCAICGRNKFSSRSNLKKHERTVHADPKVKIRCLHCDRAFTIASSLDRHLKTCKSKRPNQASAVEGEGQRVNTRKPTANATSVSLSTQSLSSSAILQSRTDVCSSTSSANAVRTSAEAEFPMVGFSAGTGTCSSSASPISFGPSGSACADFSLAGCGHGPLLPSSAPSLLESFGHSHHGSFVDFSPGSSDTGSLSSSSHSGIGAGGGIQELHLMSGSVVSQSVAQASESKARTRLSVSIRRTDPEWVDIEQDFNRFLTSAVGWCATGKGRQPCSPTTVALACDDLRFLFGFGMSLGGRPLSLSVFTSETVVKQLICKLESIRPPLSASRFYNLISAMVKAVEFERFSMPTVSMQLAKSSALLTRLLGSFAVKRKEQTQLAHFKKASGSDGKWLSIHELQQLAKVVTNRMDALASLPTNGLDPKSARKYHDLLITSMHVLAVPQRSQIYRHLEIGKTLVKSLSDGRWKMQFPHPESSFRMKRPLPLEMLFPAALSRHTDVFITRFRPLLLPTAGDATRPVHGFLFLQRDGSGPCARIYDCIRSTVADALQFPPSRPPPNPHLFRSMVSTLLLNRTSDHHRTVTQLSNCMQNSRQTVLAHYEVPDLRASSDGLNTSLAEALSSVCPPPPTCPPPPLPPLAPSAIHELQQTALHCAPAAASSSTSCSVLPFESAETYLASLNMTRKRVRFTPEETKALADGVQKHGSSTRVWDDICEDAEFKVLVHKNGIQLKEKWRSISYKKKP